MDGTLRNMTALYLFRPGEVLLLYREGGRVVNHVWTASAGGHFEKDELNDAKACVLRELQEELALSPDDLDQLTFRYITLRQTHGEIRQNYYFFANLKPHVSPDLRSNEGTCRWFPLDGLSSLEMPFTAKYVLAHYLREGQQTDRLYVGIADGEGVQFLALPET